MAENDITMYIVNVNNSEYCETYLNKTVNETENLYKPNFK
jgi:hypothetical protein